MGGWKSAEKSGSNYNCIHSIINRNDIVPRVAPGFMDFKRYGVDHYLPGSNAGSIVEGSDGNKHDNEFYKTDTASYIPIYHKMLQQLVVVNNQFAFNDDFTVQGLDLRLIRKNLLFREGEKMYMDDFLDEFVKNLCEWIWDTLSTATYRVRCVIACQYSMAAQLKKRKHLGIT